MCVYVCGVNWFHRFLTAKQKVFADVVLCSHTCRRRICFVHFLPHFQINIYRSTNKWKLSVDFFFWFERMGSVGFQRWIGWIDESTFHFPYYLRNQFTSDKYVKRLYCGSIGAKSIITKIHTTYIIQHT